MQSKDKVSQLHLPKQDTSVCLRQFTRVFPSVALEIVAEEALIKWRICPALLSYGKLGSDCAAVGQK